MAHFAELDDNNIVLQVIVVDNDKLFDENGIEQESIGISFCKKLYGNKTNWKQTSYNGNFRDRFCGPGYSYSEELDAFIPPKPYSSWVFDEEKKNWISPLGERPETTQEEKDMGCGMYYWDEEVYQADNTKGWVLETP